VSCKAADARGRRRQRIRTRESRGSQTDAPRADPGVTSGPPRLDHPLRPERALTTEEILNAEFPNISSPDRVQYENTVQCTKEMRKKLDPCYWSLANTCNGQEYLVNALANGGASGSQGVQKPDGGCWLNDTFPWIWVKKITHYRYPEPGYNPVENYLRLFQISPIALRLIKTAQWVTLKPQDSQMYVQKLPTPPELWAVPQGDFARIDGCVAKAAYTALHDTKYENKGYSPRCPIKQIKVLWYSLWIQNCSGLDTGGTIKSVLQGWVEGRLGRWSSHTWWGIQESELLGWVIPCLPLTRNYWIQYQYLATVYSRYRVIWPGYYAPKEIHAVPRPWSMICNQRNTTCRISLARHRCDTVPGWKGQCERWYQGRYASYAQEVKWVKSGGGWIRSIPLHGGCAKYAAFEVKGRRSHEERENAPYTGHGLLQIAEGHAWRQNLCQGGERAGYAWVGRNSMYSNRTCLSPEETWTCGLGREGHTCRWYEGLLATAGDTAAIVIEETAGIIGQGVKGLSSWGLSQIMTLLSPLWPILFTCFGIVALVIVTVAVLRAGAGAAIRRLVGHVWGTGSRGPDTTDRATATPARHAAGVAP